MVFGLGKPNIEKMEKKKDVKGLIKALGYKTDPWVRKYARLTLIKIGDPAIEPLINVLNDKNEFRPWQAITALGEIRDTCTIEQITTKLKDSDWEIRLASVEALKKIGSGDAIDGLITALNDSDYEVRTGAQEGLTKIGDSQVVSSLIQCQENVNNEYYIWSIMENIRNPQAVNALITVLNDPNQGYMRSCAAISLGEIGDPIAADPLASAQKSPDKNLKLAAGVALSQLNDIRADVKVLITGLESSLYRSVVYTSKVLDALTKFNDPHDVEPIIDALNDMIADKKVISDHKIKAIKILEQIGNDRAVKSLIITLNDDDYQIKITAAYALMKIGDSNALYPLIKLLKDENKDLRLDIIKYLGDIGDPRAVEALINVLDDSEQDVQNNVIEALNKIGEPAVESLINLLSDENPKMGEIAIDLIGNIGNPKAMDPLITALKDDKFSEEILLDALEKIGWNPGKDKIGADYWIMKGEIDKTVEIGEPAVKPLLRKLEREASFMEDEDLKSIIDVLGDIGDPRAVNPLFDLLGRWSSPYQNIVNALGKIGDPSIDKLISNLSSSSKDERIKSAEALVNMYKSGYINSEQKNKIFNQIKTIKAPHNDHTNITGHTDHDYDRGEYHNDFSTHSDHTDSGIGVDFPL